MPEDLVIAPIKEMSIFNSVLFSAEPIKKMSNEIHSIKALRRQ